MKDAPQELIDLVIDFVHDDHSTLRASRLVSRAWNVAARVHLFRRLDLFLTSPATPLDASRSKGSEPQRKYGAARIQQLLDILRSSSSPDMSMARFVREVVIGGDTEHLNEQWTAYVRLLPIILSILPPITTLFLHGTDWNRFPLHTPYTQAIMALCRSPKFKHLDMWNCNLPDVGTLMHILNSSVNLESLRLFYIRFLTKKDGIEDVGVTSSVDVVGGKQRQRKPLRKLTIDYVTTSVVPILDALLASPNCSLDITQLRCLSLSYADDSMPCVSRLLQAVGKTLELLEIRSWFYRRDETGYFNLSLTPRLKSLRISRMPCTSTEWLLPFFDIHPANPAATHSIPHRHPLEYLDVSVTASRTRHQAFDMTQWTTLDAALAQPLFSALKTVTIAVDVDVTLLASAFPQLLAANKIDVHIVDS